MLPTKPTILNQYGVPVGEIQPIVDARGDTIIAGRILPQDVPGQDVAFRHDAEFPTHAHFGIYCDWRVTKCKRRDRSNPYERIEDVNQSLHEFAGEIAELGELFLTNGLDCFYAEGPRKKLIDEIGDVFFCGAWLLDSMGANPLRDEEASPSGMLSAERQEEAAAFADLFNEPEDIAGDDTARVMQVTGTLGWQMSIHAGLLSNAYKKTVYQARPQSLEEQMTRVMTILSIAAYLLHMAGAHVEDALAANIEKLDARYPLGYQGPGGGNRTGKGAGSESAA